VYSAFVKYLSFAFVVVMLAIHGSELGSFTPFLLGLLFLLFYGRECKQQGTMPMTELRPGREYRVEAVLPDLTVQGKWVSRLVLSWHVGDGHSAFRITHVEPNVLPQPAIVGQRIIRIRDTFDKSHYVVTN